MCLIVFAADAHPRYKFVLAANRDEFYARPTAPAEFWTQPPDILAGKDLAAGGTWLGITRTGRFAAVTNYREPLAPKGEKSRGDFTKNFLAGGESAADYLRRIESEKDDYAGFNLLVGDLGGDRSELFYYSNRGESAVNLTAGIYGLSNHLLDTDWHKVERSKAKFAELLRNSGEIAAADSFQILAAREIAPDEKLPDTGIGTERERILSPAFVETAGYGTRSSVVLSVERNNRVKFTEKTFVGKIGEIKYEFDFQNFSAE